MNLATVAAAGWKGVLEYATTTDASGNPTGWKTLSMLADGTAGFTRSGQVTFDPPADWKTSSLHGSALLYYVRIRTTAAGTAPVAISILGRDYVNANGTTSGVIPAFDYSADTNHDGYLSDAEYARRKPGMNARFAYESRVFYPSYGQMRFVMNPGNTDVQQWAADFAYRFLQANPLADGIFVDNSNGKLPVAGTPTVESTANYSADYGALLGAISQRIAPKWIMANTAGGNATDTSSVVQNSAGAFQESGLRPLASNWQQFLDEATLVSQWQAQSSPAHYLILDSLPTGGSPTDPRTQISTLAEYYLLADPTSTFLMFYGGYSPNSSWTNHWAPAAAYDIGQPTGTWGTFAAGADPTNANLTYKVYSRHLCERPRAVQAAVVRLRPDRNAVRRDRDDPAVEWDLSASQRRRHTERAGHERVVAQRRGRDPDQGVTNCVRHRRMPRPLAGPAPSGLDPCLSGARDERKQPPPTSPDPTRRPENARPVQARTRHSVAAGFDHRGRRPRGHQLLREQLPRPRQPSRPSSRRPTRGCAATATAWRRCASSAARRTCTSSSKQPSRASFDKERRDPVHVLLRRQRRAVRAAAGRRPTRFSATS